MRDHRACSPPSRARAEIPSWSAHSSSRDSSALVQELARLARSATLPPILGAEVTKEADGRWRFALITGTSADEPTDKTTPCWDHLDRRTASIAATKSKGTPNPSLALVLPERPVRSFLASLLSDARRRLASGASRWCR